MATYHVRQGDSLASIADLLGISLYELLAVNPQVANASAVIGGQEIILPPPAAPGRSGEPGTAARREPPWLQMAKGEMARATDELTAGKANPRFAEYERAIPSMPAGDGSRTCSAFANWCIEKSGGIGTRSASARSWLGWGVPRTMPRRGCIAVFSRGADNGQQHVGFFIEDDGSRVLVLGIDQGDRASINSYPKSNLLGYRWPK